MIMLSRTITLITLFWTKATVSSFTSAASTKDTNFIASGATLLSGSSLFGCQDPSDLSRTDCLGGIAAVDAYLRNYSNVTNEPIQFTPVLDRNTVFTQLHELDVSVNRKVLTQIFNYSRFAATHSTLTSTRNMSYLQSDDLSFVLTNALVDPANSWLPFWNTVYFDEKTKIATISIQSGSQPNSFDSYSSTAAALLRISRRAAATGDGPWLPLIAFDDQTIDFDEFVAFVSDPTKVAVPAACVLKYREALAPRQTENGTWVAGYAVSSNRLTHYRISYSADDGASAAFQVNQLEEVTTLDIRTIPDAIKDHYYISRQILLKEEADAAFSNNPVVGRTGFMPLTRTGNIRSCFRGECEQGNLWTDAYLWSTGADIAFEASGGMRGPGWDAGEVTVADIWSALPFANVLCTGTVSGITLYRILNYSTAKATFTSTYTDDGDLLLQVSGLRVVYNTQLSGSSPSRLISIEVWNSKTQSYEDVERLKLYKFVTNSFVCGNLEPYATMFNSASIQGEVASTLGDVNVQQILADFLKSTTSTNSLSLEGTPLRTYNTALKGRLVNDTSAERPMESLVQSQSSCVVDQYWDESVQTCSSCPEGFYQPESRVGQVDCIVRVSDESDGSSTTLTIALVVPLAVIALVVICIMGYCFWRRGKEINENLRDLSHAPTEGTIALFFTDIQSSTKLWSTCPLSMSAALEIHNQVIVRLVTKHQLYVVKNIGDAFFVGAKDPQAAAHCVVEIQRELMRSAFPKAIDAVYDAQTDDELLDIEDDPNSLTTARSGAPFHGIRVRIGLHVGMPEVKWDDNTKGYDYFGPAANIASRTEAAGRGGQILITEQSQDYIDIDQLQCSLDSTGKHELKGVTEPVELFELMPLEMKERRLTLMTKTVSPTKNKQRVTLEQSTISRLSHEVESSSEDETAAALDSALMTEDVKFMRALLRAVRPQPRDEVLQILFRAWRIRKVGTQSSEELLRALAKRVGKVKRAMHIQEELRAMRSMSVAPPELLGSPTGGPALFSVKPVHGFSATGHQLTTAADWSVGDVPATTSRNHLSVGEYVMPNATQVESINPPVRPEGMMSCSDCNCNSGNNNNNLLVECSNHPHNMSSTSLPIQRPVVVNNNPLGSANAQAPPS